MVPGLLALITAAPLVAPPQEGKPVAVPAPAPEYPAAKPYKLNWRIEGELKLPDLAGKEHEIFAESKDKTLVLVFWSYRDPVSLFYAPVLAEMETKYAGQLAIYLVDSNQDEIEGSGDPIARIRAAVEKSKVTLPVLIDRGNVLADDFEAKSNAQAFLVDANHILRYHGGIDDDPRGERRKQGIEVQQRLGLAIDTVLKGERPEYNWTTPSGRAIKRAPKAGGAGATKQ